MPQLGVRYTGASSRSRFALPLLVLGGIAIASEHGAAVHTLDQRLAEAMQLLSSADAAAGYEQGPAQPTMPGAIEEVAPESTHCRGYIGHLIATSSISATMTAGNSAGRNVCRSALLARRLDIGASALIHRPERPVAGNGRDQLDEIIRAFRLLRRLHLYQKY